MKRISRDNCIGTDCPLPKKNTSLYPIKDSSCEARRPGSTYRLSVRHRQLGMDIYHLILDPWQHYA